MALGRADQITGAALPEPFEVFLGVDAAVKHPDAAGLAVFGFDGLDDVLEGGTSVVLPLKTS